MKDTMYPFITTTALFIAKVYDDEVDSVSDINKIEETLKDSKVMKTTKNKIGHWQKSVVSSKR